LSGVAGNDGATAAATTTIAVMTTTTMQITEWKWMTQLDYGRRKRIRMMDNDVVR
jgi:hypothetical protein